MIPFENNSDVKYKMENLLQQKLARIIKGGRENIQVVADFDYTMTSFDPLGTCFSVIRTYPGFSKEFLAKTEAIKNKYLPIHIDHTLSEDVRRASDFEWFTKSIGCFVEQNFRRDLISDMLEKSNCRLRSGVVEFLRLAHQHDIPVLIVSGGITDVIRMLLERESCYYDNIKIIANTLKFDSNDVMTGADEPFMTASSKLDVVRENNYFKTVVRDNALLLGDMLSDLKVGHCVQYKDMLSVGFCHQPERDQEAYCDSFDVILLGNPGFDVINEIFEDVIEEKNL